GLSLAFEAQLGTNGDGMNNAIGRARSFLDKALVEEELNFDTQAWMLHALASLKHVNEAIRQRNPGPLPMTEFEGKAFTNLWNNRDQLNAYTRALLALSAHYFEKTNEAKTIIANLENGVKRDERPDQSVVIAGPSTLNSQPSTVLGTAH